MKQYYFIAFFSVFFVACGLSKRKPIPQEDMVDILCDMQLANAIGSSAGGSFSDESSKDAMIAGVLKKHGISRPDFDSALVWYSDNISLYRVINDSVIEHLKVKNQYLTDQRDGMETAISELDNNIFPKNAWLDIHNSMFKFDVRDNDDLKNFKFDFNIQGLDSTVTLLFNLSYVYKDTVVNNFDTLTANTKYEYLKTEVRADSLLDYISGYFRLENEKKINKKVVLHNISYKDLSQQMSDSTAVIGEE